MAARGSAWLELLAHWRTGAVAAVNLYAYVDESGITGDSLFCVLSGYVSEPSEWKRFEQQWAEALSRADVPEFHAKVFFARMPDGRRPPPYERLSAEQAQKLLDAVLIIIDERNVYQFGSVVDVTAFKALSYGERKFVTGGFWTSQRFATSGAPSKPYFVGFQHCVAELVKKARSGQVVHFIFDRQDVLRQRAYLTFLEGKDVLAPDLAARLGDCVFGERVNVGALQAADLLTHCWYSYATNRDSMPEERRHALTRLSRGTSSLVVYDAARFEALFRQIPADHWASIRAEQAPTITMGEQEQ